MENLAFPRRLQAENGNTFHGYASVIGSISGYGWSDGGISPGFARWFGKGFGGDLLMNYRGQRVLRDHIQKRLSLYNSPLEIPGINSTHDLHTKLRSRKRTQWTWLVES